MKTSYKIAKDLVKYFDFKMIGSVLFYNDKILEYLDINDIDLACNSEDKLKKARLFLEDKGYKDIQHYTKDGYKNFYGENLIFTKENCKPIHLLFDENFKKVYSLSELVGTKYGRKDKTQLLKIINKL